MNNLSVFAERLREYMDDENLTQVQLRKIAGCANVSAWLAAKRFPYAKNLLRLSEYFKCSIDFLLGRAELPERNDFSIESCFTERLKLLAKEKNQTLFAVSKNLKMDDAILYNWGNGKYTPGVPGLILLADYFNCSIDFLLGRKE